eukprot:TRINITY_DN6102_c0_g1_i1.p1 TRINITY_DN6102_c0_g1~~TRINITY_DN6102_c0_g1_i1.p1  ORF type:complete len:179 (-),score=44.60 TRINITY_DN6102_c0_g1_i1:48-545(-)
MKGLAGLDRTSDTARATTKPYFPGYIESFEFPADSQIVIAGCNSLVYLPPQDGGKPKVVGDPLENAGLRAIHWQFAPDGATLTSPMKAGRKVMLRILHRFPFASALKRMSCVVEVRDPGQRLVIVAKGAAEIMRERMTDVPKDYDRVASTMLSRDAESSRWDTAP